MEKRPLPTLDIRQASEEALAPPGGLSALIRLAWLVAVSLTIIVLATMIATGPRWSIGGLDAVCWFAVFTPAALRYFDATPLGGEGSDRQRTTRVAYRRYLVLLASFAGVLWAVIQSVKLSTF